MKKIILLILLFLVGVSYGQSTKDVVNSSLATTILDSAGIWQPNAWRNVTGYNSATFVIKSDKSSASNGVKIYWGELINNVYRTMDSVTTSYITNTPFSLTLSVVAPYLKVKYTNTTSAQTSFLFTTMLHVGQQLKLTDEGKLSISSSGTTVNGASYNWQGTIQGSVTTEIDTTTFSSDISEWTLFAIEEKFEASLNGGFSNPVPIFPYQSYTFKNFDSSVATGYPIGVIRRKGSVGTANYVSSWMGL